MISYFPYSIIWTLLIMISFIYILTLITNDIWVWKVPLWIYLGHLCIYSFIGVFTGAFFLYYLYFLYLWGQGLIGLTGGWLFYRYLVIRS